MQIRIDRHYEGIKKFPQNPLYHICVYLSRGIITILGILRTLYDTPRRGWQSQGITNHVLILPSIYNTYTPLRTYIFFVGFYIYLYLFVLFYIYFITKSLKYLTKCTKYAM